MLETIPKSVIVAWYTPGKGELEDNIPLLWTGRHNLRLGSNNDITVVFLSGYKLLSSQYRHSLSSIGYHVVDAEKTYLTIASQYPALNRYSLTERSWFLRWVVLAKLFPSQPMIHYDGDIVWNMTPEAIAIAMKSKTLILSGGPAFAVLSSPTWLKVYTRELQKFCQDPNYGHDWRGTEFSQTIHHDQDLIDYLLQKELLPQDQLPKTKYIFAENPLLLKDKMDKNLAFYHMQTDYIHYLNLRYMLAPYGLSYLAPNPLSVSPLILKFIYLLGRIAGRGYASRLQIYQYVFD